eukprot:6184532-Pleurochrysis_carterae.AAC.3
MSCYSKRLSISTIVQTRASGGDGVRVCCAGVGRQDRARVGGGGRARVQGERGRADPPLASLLLIREKGGGGALEAAPTPLSQQFCLMRGRVGGKRGKRSRGGGGSSG